MTEGEDEAEMRAFLAAKGQTVPVAATYMQVLDLYEKAEAGEFNIFDDDIRNVKFPVLPTAALHPSQSDFERIRDVPVHEMEQLFMDSDIPVAVVVELVHILASFTQVQDRQGGERLSYKHVVPTNIISMAENSRVHTGERLCKRGLRHALDDGSPDILGANLTLAKHANNVCIIVAHKILASMKTVQYTVSSAVTATEILAAECTCKAGSTNQGPSDLNWKRLVCTHSMTIPVQMSLLMFRGMAEQVLVNLRRRARRESIESILDTHSMKQLRDDIIFLIKATGQRPPVLDMNETILEMLEGYAETTGRAKMSPGEPNPRDLGLLRDKVVYMRPEAKAARIIKNENSMQVDAVITDSTIPNTPKGTISVNEYQTVSVGDDAISLLFGKERFQQLCAGPVEAEPIGFLLALDRARGNQDTQQLHNYSAQHQARLGAANNLESLLGKKIQQRGWGKSTLSQTTSTKMPPKRTASTSMMANAPPKKKRSTLYCCVCSAGNSTESLTRVPNYPPDLPAAATEQKRKTHRIKCFKRREWMDRLGYGRWSHERDLRLCRKHPMEMVTGKSVSININNKSICVPIAPFQAPVQVGKESFMSTSATSSSGMGTDRELLRHAIKISQEEANLSKPTRVAIAKEGLVLSNNEHAPNKLSTSSGGKVEVTSWRTPRIALEMLTPDEVKRRTGYRDLKHLLRYCAVIYGGNFNDMAKTVTKMTWLEELVLYFEFSYGRTRLRMQDYESEYDCTDKVLRKAIVYRAKAELECRVRWPMYASYEEDAKFRDPSWNRHFHPTNGHRVVMHDTSNIPFPDPSSGDLNRALFQKYYDMCCAKAGVAVQLCNWIVGLPLVTGHSDDDRQVEDTKILPQQKEFSDNDKTSNRPFLNIFDKGYHQLLSTQQYGQLCCQPDQADETFGGDKVLRSGCVAVVRSGNERGVKRCKMSWFIKRGCYDQLWDIDLLCDIWEAFTFRVNFMFDKFH